MLHSKRCHTITAIDTLALLVERLTEYDWTTCTGFRWGTLTLLNDATGPDGAQEYAVIRHGRQIESLTVSWMKPAKLGEILALLDAQGFVDDEAADYGAVELREHPAGSCHACA